MPPPHLPALLPTSPAVVALILGENAVCCSSSIEVKVHDESLGDAIDSFDAAPGPRGDILCDGRDGIMPPVVAILTPEDLDLVAVAVLPGELGCLLSCWSSTDASPFRTGLSTAWFRRLARGDWDATSPFIPSPSLPSPLPTLATVQLQCPRLTNGLTVFFRTLPGILPGVLIFY